MKFIAKNRIWFICIFLFIIGLIPRLLDLAGNSAFIDEVWWMERGQLLFNNLFVDFDLGNLQKGWWQFNNTVALGVPTALLIGFFQKFLVVGGSQYTLGVYDMLAASRFPVVIFGALTPAVLFWFMQRLGHSKIGILAALMLALDPVHISMSRWVHQDAMLTLWCMITVFSFFLYEKTQSKLWKNFTIAGFVLTFLTKFNALILLPIFFFWKVWKVWKDKGGIWENKKIFQAIFNRKYAWMLFWVLIFIMLFWPGAWTIFPPYTFFKYFTNQLFITSYFDHTTFYLGEITKDPAWHYYLVILGIRLTEITLLGLILGIYIWWKKRKGDLDLWTLLWIWIIVSVIVMTIANKKLEVRYILLIYPALMVFAAWGLLGTLRRILLATTRWHGLKLIGSDLFPLILVIILIAAYNLPLLNYYHPSYYLYYNRLAGGPSGAVRLTVLGVNEGVKGAAEYVIENYPPDSKFVLIGHHEPFRYYYDLPKDQLFYDFEKHKDEIDAVMVEMHQLQRSAHGQDITKIKTCPLIIKLEEWGKLVYTVKIAGADLVYIYEKD